VQNIEAYLGQIRRHNTSGAKLNLIVSLRDREELLDEARAPPEFGLPTTPKHNAAAIDAVREDSYVRNCCALPIQLISAGMILMGKSNLSATASFFQRSLSGEMITNKIPEATLGGPLLAGKVNHRTFPAGLKKARRSAARSYCSSTGSAHGAAAGFIPIAIGTETCGSLITPAGRARVYTLKITPGAANTDGICKITIAWDTIGAFAKTIHEVAVVTGLLLQKDKTATVDSTLTNYLRKDFTGLRIDFVGPDLWAIEDDTKEADPSFPGEIKAQFELAMKGIRDLGGQVVYPVEIPAYKTFFHRGEPLLGSITNAEVKICLNEYFQSLENSTVKTLDEVIAFNKQNPDMELPPGNTGQEDLIAAAESTVKPDDLPSLRDLFYSKAGKDGAEKTIRQHNLDVVVAPVDSPAQSVSTGSMTPAATVPLGYAKINGHPFGAQLLGLPNTEPKLIEVMSAWEAIFPSRGTPDLS
ncbi:unnamed protein product, partial [Clonostachys rhizophaga]